MHDFQVFAPPELQLVFAQKEDGVTLVLERLRAHAVHVLDEPNHPDRRRRIYSRAARLVVEAHVAARHRRVEPAAGLGEAGHRLAELPHDLGVLGVPEVEAVGDRQRLRARAGDVSRGLGQRQRRPGVGVEVAEAAVAVGRDRYPLLRPLDPHDRGVRTGRHDGVDHDHVVVLLPDPALAREVRRGDEADERLLHVGRDRHRLELQALRLTQVCGLGDRPLIDRGLVDDRRNRYVGDALALQRDARAAAVGDLAHHRDVEVPLLEYLLNLFLAPLLGDEEHPLLRLGEHRLIGGHPLGALGHEIQVHLHAAAGAVGHLECRAGEPGGAHVLDADYRVRRHELEAGLEQELLGERVPHLDRRAALLASLAEDVGGHRRPVDPVAPCLRAHVDHGVSDARGLAEEDPARVHDAQREGVHEDVAVVTLVERDLAADRGYPHRVAVAPDAGHHPLHEERGPRMVGRPEAQAVHVRYRARAHREDVAEDPADAGGRPLVGLDEGGVVVALHLEADRLTVADVDDPGVLAGPLKDARTLRGEGLEVDARALVRAVLRPHDREDAELGYVGLAPHHLYDALVLVGGDPVLLDDRGGYFRILWVCALHGVAAALRHENLRREPGFGTRNSDITS